MAIKSWLAILLLGLAGRCLGAEIALITQDEPELHTTTYTAHGPDCAIVWAVRRAREFAGGFSFSERSQCALPLAQQKPYRAKLLMQLAQDTRQFEGGRGFGWGGMERGDGTDEFARRMQRVVAQSKAWDVAKGRPAKPKADPYRVVQDILNQENVFAELVEVFAEHGLLLQVRSLEKLQIGGGEVRVPFNCLVFFSVKKND